jgi:hypothetical protein
VLTCSIMLTDSQALHLIAGMRRSTESAATAALLDWVVALAQRRELVTHEVAAARAARRRERMRLYMRQWRARKK